MFRAIVVYSVPGLARQAVLEKVKLVISKMLLMIAKSIRGGIYHAIHQFAKTNNKYMKNSDKKRTITF